MVNTQKRNAKTKEASAMTADEIQIKVMAAMEDGRERTKSDVLTKLPELKWADVCDAVDRLDKAGRLSSEFLRSPGCRVYQLNARAE